MYVHQTNKITMTNEGDGQNLNATEGDGGYIIFEAFGEAGGGRKLCEFTLDRAAARTLGLWLLKNTKKKDDQE